MTPNSPENLGRYELLSQLGRGGMAETWRARLIGAAGVTRPVVIKKVLPEHARDEAFISMFISEARISATLSHGNIAQVFDFGRMDGQYFLAMELVDGQPLHRLMKRAAKTGLKRMPIPLATFIALEMSRGLHYAHSRTDEKGKPLHIVHRDISPDNVLVSYEGQVKIVDFGIAKARMLRDFRTAPGIVRGKYLYFSPEQARGHEVDARTDVWATGLVLYEMLCGRLPVTGTQAEVMMRMARGEFPSPQELREDVPSALNEIVMRALTVEASLRYPSANVMGDALASFLYPFAPRFSPMNLAYLVRELFKPDLIQDGRELVVPATFAEELNSWRHADQEAPPPPPSKRPRTPGPVPAPKEATPKRDSPPPAPERGWRPAHWGTLALVACGGLLALAGMNYWWDSREASEELPGQQGAASQQPVRYPESGVGDLLANDLARVRARQERATPKVASPEVAVAREEPPPAYPEATTFRLDSRQHILRRPLELVAFSLLDSQATYLLWGYVEERPSQSGVLAPSPRRESPIFFLLSGGPLLRQPRLGVIPHRRLPIQGARSVSLFTLGEPTTDGDPSYMVFLQDIESQELRSHYFNSSRMRISASKGLLIRGLDIRQTYGLSLHSLGEGVFLQGREQGPENQVACLEWIPTPTEAKGLVPRSASAGEPLQFLLAQGREVKVRGILGLRCGFVDDAAFDNEGEAELRITAPEPKRPAVPVPVAQENSLLKEATLLSGLGKYNAALKLSENCLAQEPRQPDCLVLSGSLLSKVGKMETALERYRTFIQHYPAHPQAPTVTRILQKYGHLKPQ
ncbi:serine/threonine protein kinase [Myxococcus qinghaiensis]|uniref:serine/threonine protein kinase n=1 Tax=Myxococcus qinghaiensis TaxID=2906758 RepID=UPI002B20FC20|nr:protein kinase [Myxococcus qinghaiensis]